MSSEQIRAVRSFNRTVTRRIGVLDQSFLDRGRPLGEARLLYEIGIAGREVGVLRDRLGLDSGYLSRLLRSLEGQGLARTRRRAGDGRLRYAEPTPLGIAELAEYERRSDGFAASLLAPLGAEQRERLVAAMAEVERLLQAAAVVIRLEPSDSAAARRCLQQYFAEIARRFTDGFDPAASPSPSPAELTPPRGAFLVARLDDAAVGCGMLRVADAATGEIKRLWVDASVRGLGIGRRLLGELEKQARRFGLDRVRLDTNAALGEAQNLYRSSGYREIPRYNDDPYAHYWFEKTL
jgi:DNA-binding MarR family transcriptional regulator/GNAT superfamily N-acetyltransferase